MDDGVGLGSGVAMPMSSTINGWLAGDELRAVFEATLPILNVLAVDRHSLVGLLYWV
jgi:hypothetical protein